MSQLADVLAQFDDTFNNLEVVAESEIPDGKYHVTVEKAELTKSQTGNPMLLWRLRIIGPDQDGQVLWHRNMIATEDNVMWLKKDLVTCGVHLDRLSELPGALDRLVGLTLAVAKKTKGEYENVYLNKRLEVPAGATSF